MQHLHKRITILSNLGRFLITSEMLLYGIYEPSEQLGDKEAQASSFFDIVYRA
jgi:hypothetical protein